MYMIILATLSLIFFGYYNLFAMLWFVAGGIFAIINLYFIKKILYEILIVNPKNLSKIALLALIKFPLLYGISFSLVFYQGEISWTVLAGFITVLALRTKKMLFSPLKIKEQVA